jgi:hypothetical protein
VPCNNNLAEFKLNVNKHFMPYFGFKLDSFTTTEGFFTEVIITPADVDDRDAIFDLSEQYNSAYIIGDKVYISKMLTPELKKEKNIDLIFLKRNNSKNQYPRDIRQLIFKIRRIETSFSQLSEQLNINRVKTKSYWGFINRIKIKILSHNISFFINTLLGKDEDISRIKSLAFG